MFKSLLIGVSILFVSMTAPSLAQSEAGCSTPGTMALSGIPTVRAEVLPSVAKNLAGIGRAAAVNNCTIEVTCVFAARDERQNSNRQCNVVSASMVSFESRPAVRSGIRSEITTNTVAASGNMTAGMVYVTLR